MHVIEIFVADGMQLLDLAGPLQVFATANVLAERKFYVLRTVSADGGLVCSSSGLAVMTQAPPRRAADTLLITGGEGMRAIAQESRTVVLVRRRAERAERVASICTGAFLLAAAGVLDGCRATTHWRWCRRLAERYPSIRVEPDAIHVRDGHVWSSAGVTAGIDLALAMVEEDIGRAVALSVARHLVVYMKRQGGQNQFSDALALQQDAGPFEGLMDWMVANLRRDLSVGTLAARAGMSERSFARHWHATTGTTPARTVERLRVEAAQQALGTTRHPIKRVAVRCGFGSAETMRRSFQRVLMVSPQDWRERFRAEGS